MLKSLKEGAKDAASKAQLEAEYLKKKATKDFRHPDEVGVQVASLRASEASLSKLHDHVKSVANHIKYVNDSYNSTSADFAAFADKGGVPSLQRITVLYTSLAEPRKVYLDTLTEIEKELSTIISTDLKRVTTIEETANRALTERDHYHKDEKNKQPTEEKYKAASGELVVAIGEFNTKIYPLIDAYVQRVVAAEVSLHSATATIVSSIFFI